MPKVQLTAILRAALISEQVDPDAYARRFGEWKDEFPEGEFEDYEFGKDGAYARPLRGNQHVLWHVHLPPESDSAAIADWTVRWQRRSRRTSDSSLIYTQDRVRGYLLLYIAREPTGHLIADMGNEASARLMNQLADAAESFIHTGRIVL